MLIPGDVTDSAFCIDAVETTVRELGRLDILVNNAAFQEHAAALEDITDEQLEQTFNTNILGYFYMARAALPHLGERSSIINTGSVTGLQGSKELLDYASTKGAIHAFTKSLAQNVVDRGIRVNCVAPGPVWTPLNPADQDADKVAKFGARSPMKRPAQPEEIAPSYVFLAAPACSSYITGEILPVVGGSEGGGGEADRRRGGQADRRTGGQADRRTGGQADRRGASRGKRQAPRDLAGRWGRTRPEKVPRCAQDD